MQSKASRQALKLTLIYVIVAGVWILFSDKFVRMFVHDPDARTWISIFKGWAFVLVTGGLLHLTVRRLLKNWEREAEQHQQTEDALRRSNERYALTERAVNDGLWDWNILTNEDYFSPRWKKIIGYSDDEFPNQRSAFLNQIHPEDLAAVKDATQRHLDLGEPYAVEFRLRHKNGSYRCVFSRGEAVRDAAGRPFRLVGAITDVTERKQAEAALQLSDFSVNQASLATFWIGRDSRIVRVNRAACLQLGYTEAEMLRLAITDLDPDFPAERWPLDWQELRAKKRHHFQSRHRHKDGHLIPVEVELDWFEFGGIEYSFTFVRDITERKLAEKKMRESEADLAEAQRIAKLGSWRYDIASHRLRWSEELCRIFGIETTLFVGTYEAFLNGVLPEDRPGVRQVNTDAIKGGTSFEIEYRIQTPAGDLKTVREIGSAVKDAGGKVVGLFGTTQDITERKKAERRIMEATNYAQTLLAASPIGLVTYRADGQAVSANEAAARLIGTTVENVKKQNFRELESWKETKFLEKAELALATGREQLFEDHTVTSYGKALWLSVRFVPFRYEGNPHLLLLAQDITERKSAEEQVQVQSSALTAAANAIVITDSNGRIEWVNPAFTKLTGYGAEEAVGGSLRMLKSGRHSTGFYANLWATIITGNVWHGEIINRRKDGRIYIEDMTVTPVRGADGKCAHFVAIKQDVTERRELELRVQRAQKMEAIGTLAGGIAHDFNNILAAMFGYGYLLKEDVLERPAQEYIGEILKAANRAKELVQQILTFSRQREFDRHVIQMHTVVKEAMKFLRASMPANIKIETHFAPDAPSILADPTQIYQVVMNLATNALHAMEDRPGQLTVRIETFQPDDAFLGLHPELKPIPYARLTVADTGHGIEAGILERIFEPFFTTKPVGKGTGLGLSVVHGILQAHEGVITVESEVGRGTTFALYFPGRTTDATVTETGTGKVPGGHGQKILLLDDEPALATVLKTLLTRLNYQVTTSTSARHAVALCRENPAQFDLVITDLTMPELNGLEVARQIRGIRPDTPVILTSGFSVELNREDLIAAGISELLKKPVGMNQLAEAVQRVLTNNDRRPPASLPPS